MRKRRREIKSSTNTYSHFSKSIISIYSSQNNESESSDMIALKSSLEG